MDNLHRSLTRAAVMAALFLAGLIPLAPALAQDSSPYVVGHWRLNDSFADFVDFSRGPINTDNTDFVFLNPTGLILTLEYAFFAPDGTFCGCDRDTLQANGRTRYTMRGEQQANLFSTTKCPAQTEGALKSIVFTSADKIGMDGALQAGVQTHIFGSSPGQWSESNLQGIPITPTTVTEMNNIHTQCVGFLGAP